MYLLEIEQSLNDIKLMKVLRELIPDTSESRAKELVKSLDCQGIAIFELLIDPVIMKEMLDDVAIYSYEIDSRYD